MKNSEFVPAFRVHRRASVWRTARDKTGVTVERIDGASVS